MAKKKNDAQVSDAALEIIADRFRILSEPTRLKLLQALKDGECSVNELVRRTGKNQANVSRQLKVLSDARILARRRQGVQIFYAITDRAVIALCAQVCGSLASEFERLCITPPSHD